MNFGVIENEVKFVAVRSRGPGGQNVNKVSSAAVLLWAFSNSQGLTDYQKSVVRQKLTSSINKEEQIFLRSDEFRDLERNKQKCLEKLKSLLISAFHVPKHRRATKPTRSARLKRLDGKIKRGETKKNRQRIR